MLSAPVKDDYPVPSSKSPAELVGGHEATHTATEHEDCLLNHILFPLAS